MRVLFIERSLNRGGAQSQMMALSMRLARRGHNVVLAVFYDELQRIDELTAAGVDVRIIGKSGRADIVGFWRRLRTLVSESKPDLLCTFLPVPNILGTLCKRFSARLPLVAGIRASNVDMRRYDWLARIVGSVEPWFMRFADRIVANSRAGRTHAIARGFPPDRIEVIFNGIDTERFKPDQAARARRRREWGYSDEAVLIGIVGRLDPMKDHRTFLEAAALFGRRHPEAAFVCVGDDGPITRDDLREVAVGLGIADRTQWVPGSDDVSSVFNACDLVCSTSASGEGFSNTLAEAMACGRRCVATDVGEARTILGDVGRIVPPSNPAAVADALGELCDELRRHGYDCEAARRRIVDSFSVDEMVTRFEEVFRAVAATKR